VCSNPSVSISRIASETDVQHSGGQVEKGREWNGRSKLGWKEMDREGKGRKQL